MIRKPWSFQGILLPICLLVGFLWSLLWKTAAVALTDPVLSALLAVNFCCSHKHWPNIARRPPVAYRTTQAELFYLRHVPSCAASALGSRSTSSRGSTTEAVPSHLLDLARMCDGFVRWAAQAYEKAACIYSLCRLCGPGTIRWQTAVALATEHPVLATALLEALTMRQPCEMFIDSDDMFSDSLHRALRLTCVYAVLISIALGIHAPQLWQCRTISALFSAGLCSESLLSAAISAMRSWEHPAFPPRCHPNAFRRNSWNYGSMSRTMRM